MLIVFNIEPSAGVAAREMDHQPQAGPLPVAGAGFEPATAASSPQSTWRRTVAHAGASRAPDHVWTYEFLQDHCANGQALRILTLVDEFARECLAIEDGASLGARRVIAVLERAFAEHGPPEWLRSDNGPEFIAQVRKRWLAEWEPKPRYIDPGCTWQNPYGESFKGRFHAKCLDRELFANRREAVVVLEVWRHVYDVERPHSSLGYRTPREFRAAWIRGEIPDPGVTPGNPTHGP
jgi:transposase InsO family protein